MLVELKNLSYTVSMFLKQILRVIKTLGVFFLLLFVIGCSAQSKSTDRFECLNRGIYAFNKKADKFVIKPTAKVYEAIIPKGIRNMVSNFFQNLNEIPTVANDILQGKFALAGNDMARFLINSTWGIGGLFDFASKGGMERHRQDFGLTLAKWGYQDSAFIMLPILGPTTFRDGVGKVVTYEMGIPAHLKSVAWRNRLMLLNYIDIRTNLLKVEPAIDESIDEYVFIRDAYLQHRQYEINGKEAGLAEGVTPAAVKLEEPPE